MDELTRLKADYLLLMRELKVLRNGCGWATAQDNFKDMRGCVLTAWERSQKIRAEREVMGFSNKLETGVTELWD